jgi:hypothetical protein
MELVEHGAPGMTERISAGNKNAPLSRDERVSNVEDAVYGEEPHHEQVISDTLGQAILKAQSLEQRPGKEMGQCPRSPAHPINGVSPINEKPRPNHERQQREMDPVKPTNGSRVLAGRSLFHDTPNLLFY